MAKNERQYNDFDSLCRALSRIDAVFEDNAAKAINKNITARNWLTGYYIVNYEQNGNDRAQYGAKTLQKLAERLDKRSLSYRNLKLYRQFYSEYKALAKPILEFISSEFGLNEQILPFLPDNLAISDCQNSNLANTVCPIGQSVTAQSDEVKIPPEILFNKISFTHLSLLMSVEDPLGRTFYELEIMKGVWSVRELKRQIDSNYFERTALSREPAKMSALVQARITKSGKTLGLKDVVKDPYVYEFVGLKDKDVVEESDLENALTTHLEEFLLELGNGFCFETR